MRPIYYNYGDTTHVSSIKYALDHTCISRTYVLRFYLINLHIINNCVKKFVTKCLPEETNCILRRSAS